MSADPHAAEVARLAAELKRDHPIRLQMLGVVTLAGLAGFLASFALLHLGFTWMAARYAIATLAGYGAFVWTVRIWLLGRDASSALNSDGHGSSGWSFNGLGRLGGKASSKSSDGLFSGGRSGGGGASASFGSPNVGQSQMLAMAAQPQPQSSSSGGGWLGKLGGKGSGKSGGSGKGLLPLLVIALIVIGLAVVGRVVWQSPNLLAEMLVDGAVAGSAIRGVQRAHRHREIDVISHTWIPALIVLVLMVTIGWAAQSIDPQAVSIGDVFR